MLSPRSSAVTAASPERRPPPDYTSRSVKLRLFIALAAIMLVAALAERMLTRSKHQPPPPDQPFTNLLHEEPRTAHDPPGTFVAESASKSDAGPENKTGIHPAELPPTHIAAARSQIQDDTPILRPAEGQIWFHEFSRLARDAAIDDKPPSVGYLQLSRQPADYRGKLVTIKGNVRRAYRSAASENQLGIYDYCVYWLYPAGGPDAPIVVYALDAPPGFPQLAKNAQAARNNFHEDVEVTGIFFKRCAYAGQGGTYTAPLLLAKIPVWLPSPPPFSATPSPNLAYELGGAALAALVLAICVTAVLWKRSAGARSRPHSLSAASLIDLNRAPTVSSPDEYFRQLNQQQGSGK